MLIKRVLSKIVIVFILSLHIVISGCADKSDAWLQSAPAFKQNCDEFLKGPYLQNVKQNSMTIMWESAEPVKGAVFWGKQNVEENSVSAPSAAKIHEITLTGLQPETVYQYKVQSGERLSKVYTFKTAVQKDSPFSFVVYGDNKNGPFNHLKNARLIKEKNPNFVIHVGDLVDKGRIYEQYDKLFFSPARELMHSIPLFPLLGNHEDHAHLFADFFSLPNNEQWYSFDFGVAHFIILDDSDEEMFVENKEQLQWLENDLRNIQSEWTFVFFHIPPFTAGGGYFERGRLLIKNTIHPILEKFGVDLVFSGDDHDYERTVPIVSRRGEKPVTYFVCGNGGTSMRYVGKREWTAYSKRTFGFVQVHIEGPRLFLESISIDGQVIDELVLDKSDPQSLKNYEKQKIYFEDIHDPEQAAKLYSKGKKNLKRKNYPEAMSYFREALQVDSTCAEAVAGIAKCYYEAGMLDSSRIWAMRAIDILPAYPLSYEVLSDVCVAENKIEEALEWCDRWLAIEPDSPEPNAARADIYKDRKQYKKAIAEMKRALEILPNESDMWFDLGKLYEKVGDVESAVFCYERGLYWHLDEGEDENVTLAKERLAELETN